MYSRHQTNILCKAMSFKVDGLKMLIRDFKILSKTKLRTFFKFRNMSRGGVGNIFSFRRSMMRVSGVISHKNLDALLLGIEMLIVLDLPTFKGVSLICGLN